MKIHCATCHSRDVEELERHSSGQRRFKCVACGSRMGRVDAGDLVSRGGPFTLNGGPILSPEQIHELQMAILADLKANPRPKQNIKQKFAANRIPKEHTISKGGKYLIDRVCFKID